MTILLLLASATLCPASPQEAQIAASYEGFSPTNDRERPYGTRVVGDSLFTLQYEPIGTSFWNARSVIARKVDRKGDLVWESRWAFEGGQGIFDYVKDFDVSSDGRLAFVYERTQDDYRVQAFTAEGALGWNVPLGQSTAGTTFYSGSIRATADGGWVIGGGASGIGTIVRQVDGSGATVWTTEFMNPEGFGRVAVVSDGSLRVVSSTDSVSAPGVFALLMHRLASDGQIEWTRSQPTSARSNVRAFEVDDAGNAYVVGRRNQGGDFRAWKTSPSAALVWTRLFDFNQGFRGFGLNRATGEVVITLNALGANDRLLVLGADGATLTDMDVPHLYAEQRPTQLFPESRGALWTSASEFVVLVEYELMPTDPSSIDRGGAAIAYRTDGAVQWTMPLPPVAEAFVYSIAARMAENGDLWVTLPHIQDPDTSSPGTAERVRAIRIARGSDVGSNGCAPAILNSVGERASITAFGDSAATTNRLDLFVEGLPPGAALLYLAALDTGFVPNAGGGQGTLCLGGPIGRFLRPGELRFASPTGTANLALDLTSLPAVTQFLPAVAGETWHFQGWYRDFNPSGTSNMTDRTDVLFD